MISETICRIVLLGWRAWSGRNRRYISRNISVLLGRMGGRGRREWIAEITIAALSSETQNREAGDWATFRKISGIMILSARRS